VAGHDKAASPGQEVTVAFLQLLRLRIIGYREPALAFQDRMDLYAFVGGYFDAPPAGGAEGILERGVQAQAHEHRRQ